MKKLFCIMLCMVLMVVMAVPASAALEYTYIDTIHSSITFNQLWGVANCSATVDSLDENMLEIEVTLQMNGDDGWEDLKTWTNSGYYDVEAGGQYAVARGYEYRLYITAYVYNDSGRIVESGTQINTKWFS